jgi:hypothetical protein
MSNQVGYDLNKNEYFCKLCGRAGYSTLAQVRGHLSQCPNKNKVEKYLIKEPNIPNISISGGDGLVAGGGANNNTLMGATSGGEIPKDILSEINRLAKEIRELDKRILRIERYAWNESNHLSQIKTNGLDWNKLLLGALILFGAYFLYRAGKVDTLGSVMIRKGLEGLDF